MAATQLCLSQSVIREEYFEISPEQSSARTLEFPKAKGKSRAADDARNDARAGSQI